jgi:hypothetical protein
MTTDKYDGVSDGLLSHALLMDAGLARLVQTKCEKMGLFTKISFLEARERMINLSGKLKENDFTIRTHFDDRSKKQIIEYISQFSNEERRVLVNAGYEDNPAGSLAVRSVMSACGYKD